MAKPRSLFSFPLIRELSAVLVIKLALIFVIKAMFFSDPVDMKDPQEAISQQFGLNSSHSNTSQAEDLQ